MSIKLNIFQRGILQKCATVLVYLFSIGLGAFILDWIDKRLFIRLAEEARQKEILSEKATGGFIALIEARDSTAIFAIILVGLGCGLIGWLFMRWAAKRNWSWPVTLPKTVEFRSAMERLGIVDPDERIYFVRKHKLPVFIAPKPLVGIEQTEVRVQLYPYASHSSLGDKEVFELHTGKQTLCLDAADYERLLKEHGPKTRSAYAAKIAELEQNLTDLKAVNSLQSADIAALTEENKKLSEENDVYRNKQRTAPGRGEVVVYLGFFADNSLESVQHGSEGSAQHFPSPLGGGAVFIVNVAFHGCSVGGLNLGQPAHQRCHAHGLFAAQFNGLLHLRGASFNQSLYICFVKSFKLLLNDKITTNADSKCYASYGDADFCS